MKMRMVKSLIRIWLINAARRHWPNDKKEKREKVKIDLAERNLMGFFKWGRLMTFLCAIKRTTHNIFDIMPKLLRNFVIQCGTLIILLFNFRLRNFRLTTGVKALFN